MHPVYQKDEVAKATLKKNAKSFEKGMALIDLWFEAKCISLNQSEMLTNYLANELFPIPEQSYVS